MKHPDQRFLLTIIYTVLAAIIVVFTLVRFGKEHLEIVTLILGLVGNQLIGGPNGLYFGGEHGKKPESGSTTAEVTASITSTPEA